MFTLCFVALVGGAALHAAPPFDAERQALAYLAREVPRWSREHSCFSCHNNGDAARALYTALRLGRSVKDDALADTTRWLARPADWRDNGGDGPFNDRKLAALNFAFALVSAAEAGRVKDRKPLEDAARLVAGFQDKDGSWRAIPDGTLGSPITLGNTLATHFGRTVLHRADEPRYRDAIRRADGWLRRAPPDSVLDAGATLLAQGKTIDAPAQKRRFDLLRKGEARGGGWGPYVNSQPEPFDTALVLLALTELEQTAEVKAWRKRGRAFLLSVQEEDGSWPETTRPAGADSYAQRLSTTGWAALALLATRK